MSTAWIIALVIGALIIAGLSFYLGRLLLLLKHKEQSQQAKIEKRNITLAENIYTIAWAMRDDQCELSEGCLRVWVLLDHIVPDPKQPALDNQQQYPGVFALYEKVKDLPTHDARKKVKKPELRAMDQQRLKDEVEFKSLIESDIEKLINRFKVPS